MRVSFPVSFTAVYTGQSGESGSFKDRETGEVVSYEEAHAFDFDSAEGLVQRLVLRENKFNEAAEGFRLADLTRYRDEVVFEGDVVIDDNPQRGGYFRPTQVRRAEPAAAPKPKA